MKVLIYAGPDTPLLSDAAVLRLRELGWPSSKNPNDMPNENDCHQGMMLKGELGWDISEGPLLESFNPLERMNGERHDPLVLQVFEEMGQDMFTDKHETLQMGRKWPPDPPLDYPGIVQAVEIPDGVEYEIIQDEGSWESIHEKHRIWRIQL